MRQNHKQEAFPSSFSLSFFGLALHDTNLFTDTKKNKDNLYFYKEIGERNLVVGFNLPVRLYFYTTHAHTQVGVPRAHPEPHGAM